MVLSMLIAYAHMDRHGDPHTVTGRDGDVDAHAHQHLQSGEFRYGDPYANNNGYSNGNPDPNAFM
jgi:hypothetical protein